MSFKGMWLLIIQALSGINLIFNSSEYTAAHAVYTSA